MPVRGRCLLLVAIAGFALGAGPAVGAKHRKGRLIAKKARAHGHVPARGPGRPPLVGTLPLPGTTPTTPTTTGPVPTTPTPSCPTAVGVTEGEYYTHPSRTAVCPGSIVMELENAGQDDHDLKVLDVDSGTIVATWAIAHPGDAVQKHLTLSAGTYRLFCTLSDGNGVHDDLGMHAVITVG
jgi:plastocyanin